MLDNLHKSTKSVQIIGLTTAKSIGTNPPFVNDMNTQQNKPVFTRSNCIQVVTSHVLSVVFHGKPFLWNFRYCVFLRHPMQIGDPFIGY